MLLSAAHVQQQYQFSCYISFAATQVTTAIQVYHQYQFCRKTNLATTEFNQQKQVTKSSQQQHIVAATPVQQHCKKRALGKQSSLTTTWEQQQQQFSSNISLEPTPVLQHTGLSATKTSAALQKNSIWEAIQFCTTHSSINTGSTALQENSNWEAIQFTNNVGTAATPVQQQHHFGINTSFAANRIVCHKNFRSNNSSRATPV